jgi:MFS family permease
MPSFPRWWPTGGLWRHPDFLRLWGAQAGSALGSRVTRTALPILAILSLSATPTQVAVMSALGVAPGVFAALLAGGYVDRRPRRPLLIGADLARAALLLTIPAAAWAGALSMPHLYLVAAAAGAATTLFQVADNSYLPALVGPERLVEGNARLEATESVAETAGPGIAGVLVELLTAPVAIALDALSYLWSALLLGRIRAREEPAAPPAPDDGGGVWSDVAAGFRACAGDARVGPVLAADGLAHLFGGFFLTLYTIFALETLGLSPAVLGVVISVGGVGALAGALVAGPLGRRLGTGRAMIACFVVGQAIRVLTPLALHVGPLAIPFLVVGQLVGDALLTVWVIHALSLRQRLLPRQVLGRANAAFHVVTGLLLTLGALVSGPLASAAGISTALWIGSLGGLLAVPVLLASPIARMR